MSPGSERVVAGVGRLHEDLVIVSNVFGRVAGHNPNHARLDFHIEPSIARAIKLETPSRTHVVVGTEVTC
jgi:hypothetical protein